MSLLIDGGAGIIIISNGGDLSETASVEIRKQKINEFPSVQGVLPAFYCFSLRHDMTRTSQNLILPYQSATSGI